MSSISLSGGTLITPLETRFCNLTMDDGLITALGDNADAEKPSAKTIDVSDCYITPGLIDLQVNGGPQCNFWGDPTDGDVRAFSDALLKAGVTTILPTLITDDIQHLQKNIRFLKSLGVGPGSKAGINPNKSETSAPRGKKSSQPVEPIDAMVRMPGIHLEGPCLSPKRPGVHPPQHIQPLTIDVLKQITDEAVLLMTVAPEKDPALEAVDYLLSKGVVVSLGHSNATFEEAEKAFSHGIKLMTHTFNALPAVHHRAPGAVTAALLDDTVTCAIICDGLHVAPEAVKLVFKAKTKSRTILVTDSAFVGTASGGLVGSSITLNQAVENVVKWNAASFADAVQMASWNPAKAVGLHGRLGHLEVGKVADIVVWNRDTLNIKHVFLAGQQIF